MAHRQKQPPHKKAADKVHTARKSSPPAVTYETKPIKTVIRWQNGMVMVFDTDGEQVPDLQGPYEEVKEAVLAAADSLTLFVHGQWPHFDERGIGDWKPVRREEW